MEFIYSDGGRQLAGFKGNTGDCVTRAIAIATQKPYQEVYDALNKLSKVEKPIKGKNSLARTGVFRKTYENYLLENGWKWTPCMKIGQGCKVHLRKEELPIGRLIVSVSRHLTAVIDGVLYDNHDCSRDGSRCVYGYYMKEN
jgi:hypothetical protein